VQRAISLGASERRARAGTRCQVRRVVKLVEGLAGLHRAAFGEQALRDDAIDLRTYFRDEEGRGATRQRTGERDRPGGQRNHRDRYGISALLGLGLAAASGQRYGGERETQQSPWVRRLWG